MEPTQPPTTPSHSRFQLGLSLAKHAIGQGFEDNIPRLGAALAFYALLSIVPMLVLLASVASAFYGSDVARDQIYNLVSSFAGHRQADTIRDLLDGASQHADVGSKTALLNVAILFYGASSVFTQLQEIMNLIWKVPAYRGKAFIPFIKENLLSLLMVFVIGMGMVALILANVVVTVVIHYVTGLVPAFEGLIQAGNFFLNFFLLTLAFAVSFKYIPARKIAWSDVRLGALITALLFSAGQYLIGFYLGHAGFLAGYGAAGSIVALLIWLYYSMQIFFFGAEFAQAYATNLGSCRDEKQPAVTTS